MALTMSGSVEWSASALTSGALVPQHRFDGVQHDEEIKGHRQILDVEEVVLQLLECIFHAGAIRITHLRPTGEAGSDDMALTVERNLASELGQELGALGPRA